jgi:hypothetical protein
MGPADFHEFDRFVDFCGKFMQLFEHFFHKPYTPLSVFSSRA